MTRAATPPQTQILPGTSWTACRGTRGALHAEWTKLRTLPATPWLLAATAALTVLVSAAADAATRCPSGPACPVDTGKLSLTGIQFGQTVVAILAVLAVGGEYHTGMIRSTLTAMPRRATTFIAKATAVTVPVLAAGTVAAFGSLLAGWILLPHNGFTTARGYSPLTPSQGPVLRATAGSVLYLGLIALLATGIAAAVRDTAVAIGAVLGLLYVFPIIAAAAHSPHWQRHLEQIGPMTAGLQIQATRNLHTLPISPWAGLGVLAAWSATALIAGGLLLQQRDA
jgi:ABC-2 type transport system permease protein